MPEKKSYTAYSWGMWTLFRTGHNNTKKKPPFESGFVCRHSVPWNQCCQHLQIRCTALLFTVVSSWFYFANGETAVAYFIIELHVSLVQLCFHCSVLLARNLSVMYTFNVVQVLFDVVYALLTLICDIIARVSLVCMKAKCSNCDCMHVQFTM